METITLEKYQEVLNTRFGGVLKYGKHLENGECCILELRSVCLDIPWTDDPIKTNDWDLRKLNDIRVSNKTRTRYLLPVITLYGGARLWEKEKQQKIIEKIVIYTINRIIPQLPNMKEDIKQQCKNVSNLFEAKLAAAAAAAADDDAAAAAAATAAAVYAVAAADAAAAVAAYYTYAADAAADAAVTAAHDTYAAREQVFITACQLWIDAYHDAGY